MQVRSTREIAAHLQEMFGTEVSPSLIPAITDTVADEVRGLQSRPLDRLYPILYLDCLMVMTRKVGHSANRAIYLAIGVNTDGLKGFPEAIEAVYPRAEVQLCLVHLVRHSLNFVSWTQRKDVATDLRTIYTAPTADEATVALEKFVESVNFSLRKLIKMRGAFPTDEAAFKLLYLGLRNIGKRWTMPIQNWKQR